MAFRPDTENRSRPSLGYRISSNRQPGVEIANNRMPSMPRFSPGDMPFPRPGEGRPAPMPMPMPRRTPEIPESFLRRQGISSLTPFDIGVDRGPTTMDPIMTMLNNPQVMRDFNYATDLEDQMDPDNFFENRLDVSEQFNVDPFGDIDYPRISVEFGNDEMYGPSQDGYYRGGIASLRR